MEILKNLWYMARRFKTATALNLLGLTVAFTAFYLLMTQVEFSRYYNRSLPGYERMFRLEWMSDAAAPWNVWTARPFIDAVSQLPQVEDYILTQAWAGEASIDLDGSRLSYRSCSTDGHALTMYGAVAVDGRLTWDEGDEEGILIPASLAKTCFGQEQVAGRMLRVDKDSVTIRGVYRDLPENSLAQNAIYTNMGNESADSYSEWSYTGSVKLREGINVEEFQKLLKPTIFRVTKQLLLPKLQIPDGANNEEIDEEINKFTNGISVRMCPYTETYYSGVDKFRDKGNPVLVWVLTMAAWLLVVVATVNFLNFTLAESPMRLRGINTRRVLGSSVWRLRLQLVGETLAVTLFSCIVGLALCAALSTLTTELLMGSASLAQHPGLCVLCLLCAVCVGLVAGVYPAWFCTSFPPALALKGNFGLTRGGQRMRYVLLGLQLCISLLLVCFVGILLLQSRHIHTSDYGFDKDQLAYAYLRSPESQEKKAALKTELERMAGIQGVAFSQMSLGTQDQYMGWGRNDEDHVVNFDCFFVDENYFDVMGIGLRQGRKFTAHDNAYIVNPAMARAYPWIEMGRPLLKGDFDVVGVCDDVQFTSMRHNNREMPFAFIHFTPEKMQEWGGRDRLVVLNVRMAAGTDKLQLRRQIQQTAVSLTGDDELEFRFLDERMEHLYRDEFRFIRQVISFSVICLVLTLIGVFCLTMFETEYRHKEIGIRKVFGSTETQILRLLSRRYLLLLALAFVIAVPVALWLGREWLQGFAERTPIYWWLFPLTLMFVAFVTLLTVTIQGWRAATENPINSIKTE